jgi:hypothetical protein
MTLDEGRISSAQPDDRAKRQAPMVEDPRRRAMITRVEARFAASDPRDKTSIWKFDKDDPQDRQDMITVARNLHSIMAAVPRGRKTAALAAAGFNGQEQSGYLGNVCLAPDIVEISTARLRRLTPRVDRYWGVALGCGLERQEAIARLFANTSFDGSPERTTTHVDWADRLADVLTRLATDVGQRTELAMLFDRMSRANLCLADETGFDPRVTDWLSTTFHKDDFSRSVAEKPDGFWLYDREEEGVPRGGLPLFSPKVPIESRSVLVDASVLSRTGKGGANPALPDAIQITFASTLYLAIVPTAMSLDAAAGVALALMERPSAHVSYGGTNEPIWSIEVRDERIGFRTEETIWDVAFPTHPAIDSDLIALAADRAGSAVESPDLGSGCWQCFPLTSLHVRDRLGRPAATKLLPDSPRRGITGRRVLEHDDIDPSGVDWHAVDPTYFPPLGSIASALSGHLGKGGAIASRLEHDARSMGAAFDGLIHRLREAAVFDDDVV